MDYAKGLKTQDQQTPIIGREKEMTENSAGGFVFSVDQWTLLNRFLILGSEGGTYYITQNDLTKINVDNIVKCIKDDEKRVLSLITDISINARAPKNDPAIFILACLMAYGSKNIKKDV